MACLEDVAPAALLRAQAAGRAERAEGRCRDGRAALKVTQTRSEIGGKQNQRETLRSLGLKRIGDVVVKEDRPEIRGMVKHGDRTSSPSRRWSDHG